MYFQYWLFLFFWLSARPADVLCAIDLDTIVPVYYASIFRRRKRVYDAHEIFTDLKEVITRPLIHKLWTRIGNYFVPRFQAGYTIGDCYAEELNRRYGVHYEVVRNATVLRPGEPETGNVPYILYQGWVNEGRCFEQLIPAMKQVDAPLIVCGEGNFYERAVALTKSNSLTDKVIFKGYVPPDQLSGYTRKAYAGVTLFDDSSLSNRLSLANRFFDYMHAGVPQICNSYPEYARINKNFEVACLVDENCPEKIAAALNRLLTDTQYYHRLRQNCLKAREQYCWQEEEKKLLTFYETL